MVLSFSIHYTLYTVCSTNFYPVWYCVVYITHYTYSVHFTRCTHLELYASHEYVIGCIIQCLLKVGATIQCIVYTVQCATNISARMVNDLIDQTTYGR